MQPQYRLRTERSMRVLVVSGGRQVGVIEGDYPPWENGAFKINNLSFRDEFLDTEIICDALHKLLDETDADRILWEYPEPEGCSYQTAREDPRYRLLKLALKSRPDWELSWVPHGWNCSLDFTAIAANIWHESHYSEERIAETGMEFLPIAAAEDYADEICALCASDPETEFMEPLYFAEADAELSFLALWHGEVAGWLIMQRKTADEAHIPIFYAAKKFRARGGGGKIAAHMVRLSSKSCRRVTFCLRPEATANRRFYTHYFKDALTVSRLLRLALRRKAIHEYTAGLPCFCDVRCIDI